MSICLQKNVRHKFFVKVRPFSATKVSCMVDHVRPIILDDKPDHVILHTGTNDLRSEKTVNCQIYYSNVSKRQCLFSYSF